MCGRCNTFLLVQKSQMIYLWPHRRLNNLFATAKWNDRNVGFWWKKMVKTVCGSYRQNGQALKEIIRYVARNHPNAFNDQPTVAKHNIKHQIAQASIFFTLSKNAERDWLSYHVVKETIREMQQWSQRTQLLNRLPAQYSTNSAANLFTFDLNSDAWVHQMHHKMVWERVRFMWIIRELQPSQADALALACLRMHTIWCLLARSTDCIH